LKNYRYSSNSEFMKLANSAFKFKNSDELLILIPLILSNMKLPWFKRFGIVYIPINLIGWIILAMGVVYAINLFIEIDSQSHSVSDTLMNFVFNLLIIGAAYTFIAFLTSKSLSRKQ